MAKKLLKKDLWKKSRIRMDEGFIEVRELKRLQTVFAVFAMSVGILLSVMLVVSLGGPVDVGSIIAASFFTLLPFLFTSLIYRPPRVLRLYPDEQVAQRFRSIFGMTFLNRWLDLSAGSVAMERVVIITKEAKDREGGGAAALGCLFALLGPLGLLLSVGLLREKREVRTGVFGVTAPGLGEPLVLFETRAQPKRIAELYEALRDDGPSDLLSDV